MPQYLRTFTPIAAGILAFLSGNPTPAAPAPPITISRATTFITRPLDKDGLPNYKLALQQYLMKGVTPKNNAAVPAIEIAMQGFHDANIDRVYPRGMGAYQLQLLGVPPPTKAIPRIYMIDQFFKEHPPQGFKLPPMTSLGGPNYWAMEQLEEGYALDFPWRSSQCFELWTAMSENKAAAETMRKASLLPRFYLPLVWNPKRFKPPIASFLPLGYVMGLAGDYMAYHATLELGRNHMNKSWDDTITVYRLAKLAQQQPDRVGAGTANMLLWRFLYVDRVLLAQLRGHPRRLARMWKMIHAIAWPPPLGQRFIHVLRLQSLKLLLSCYRDRQNPPIQPLVQTLSKQTMPLDIVRHPPAAIDWNWQFLHLNETFDQLEAMAPAAAYSLAGKRLRALEGSWTNANYYVGVLGGWNPGTVGHIPKSLKRLLAKKLPLNTRYHNMALLASSAIDDWPSYQTLRSLMLVKIAYALEIYRNAHGNYPATLAALSPAYFKHPPVDPKTGQFPVYIRRRGGYELALAKWVLNSRWKPFVSGVSVGGPLCITMPPPAPTGWQKGPFP